MSQLHNYRSYQKEYIPHLNETYLFGLQIITNIKKEYRYLQWLSTRVGIKISWENVRFMMVVEE